MYKCDTVRHFGRKSLNLRKKLTCAIIDCFFFKATVNIRIKKMNVLRWSIPLYFSGVLLICNRVALVYRWTEHCNEWRTLQRKSIVNGRLCALWAPELWKLCFQCKRFCELISIATGEFLYVVKFRHYRVIMTSSFWILIFSLSSNCFLEIHTDYAFFF